MKVVQYTLCNEKKNAEFVLRTLRESGWILQNVIIWRKKTSAVPVATKFGKQYQVSERN